MLSLYVRIRFRNRNGYEESKSFALAVGNPSSLTDEKCEQLLTQIGQNMLKNNPNYTEVVDKEFISKAEFDANRRSKEILLENNAGKKAVCYIYFKGIGLFPELANQNGAGEDGPEIPFRVPSATLLDRMSSDDIEKLKKTLVLLCQTRFSKTPKDIILISESEYNMLMKTYNKK